MEAPTHQRIDPTRRTPEQREEEPSKEHGADGSKEARLVKRLGRSLKKVFPWFLPPFIFNNKKKQAIKTRPLKTLKHLQILVPPKIQPKNDRAPRGWASPCSCTMQWS